LTEREILENGENPKIATCDQDETFSKTEKIQKSQNAEPETKMRKTRISQKLVLQESQ